MRHTTFVSFTCHLQTVNVNAYVTCGGWSILFNKTFKAGWEPQKHFNIKMVIDANFNVFSL